MPFDKEIGQVTMCTPARGLCTHRWASRKVFGANVLRMFRFMEPLIETEVGVRAAREQLPDLLKTAEEGDHVIHISRHGKRVSALVSSNVAESVVAIRGIDGPVIPGDLSGAIKIVESLLIGDEGPGP